MIIYSTISWMAYAVWLAGLVLFWLDVSEVGSLTWMLCLLP